MWMKSVQISSKKAERYIYYDNYTYLYMFIRIKFMVFYRKNKEKKHNSVSYAESYFVFPKNHSQKLINLLLKFW